MGSFVACYLIVWIAVMVYIAHLGTTQRKLQHSLKQLQNQLEKGTEARQSSARAA